MFEGWDEDPIDWWPGLQVEGHVAWLEAAHLAALSGAGGHPLEAAA
jgi:hypothetical protein